MSQDPQSSPLLAPQPTQSQENGRSVTPETENQMAAADISPAPEQLDIHRQPEAGPPSSEDRPVLAKQFTLEGQESVASTAAAKVNPVRLCVYTLKEGVYCKMKFESGRLTTAQHILEKMREAFGVPEEIEQVFSIWLTSKHLQLQLKSYHLPCKLFKRWKDLLSQYTSATFEEIAEDEPILSFQRNAFLTLKEERNLLKKQDFNDPDNYRKAIDLLYHEAVFHTTRGRYPFTAEEFHAQAGLQAAIKAIDEDFKSPEESILSQVNIFYPPHMRTTKSGGHKVTRLFRKTSVETKGLSNELMSSYQAALKKCKDSHQLKILYLQFCWHKAYYGSVFFKGLVERSSPYLKHISGEKPVVVAINPECLHLMSASAPSDVLLYLTYDQMSWEFQAPSTEGEEFFSSLLLEFDSVLNTADNKRVAKRLQIFSRQAPMMDAMISRCVACINKEEEKLRQLRIQQGNREFLDYNIKTDGRVQKQEANYKEHKLQCTVLTEEGKVPGSGFTLSRVLKRRGSAGRRSSQKREAASTELQQETAPLTPKDNNTEMSSVLAAAAGASQDPSHTLEQSITTKV